MTNLLVEHLKTLSKPKVVFFHHDNRYEGIIISMDDTYIKFHDPVRCYTKFLRISEINDLEVKDE